MSLFPRLTMLAASVMAASSVQAAPRKAPPAPAPVSAWAGKISVTPAGGHIIGNPQAPQRLVEFMSYTCSHCAHFDRESAPLFLGPVPKGSVSFEVRHLLRDPIDATIAMLTNCVPPVRFAPLHHRFLADQEKWFAIAQKVTPEQTKRWNEGAMPQRMRLIASDLKFYDIAASAGLSRAQAEGCFANEAILRRLVAQTKQASDLGINGTPAFLLNEALTDDHDWAGVQARLAAPKPAQ